MYQKLRETHRTLTFIPKGAGTFAALSNVSSTLGQGNQTKNKKGRKSKNEGKHQNNITGAAHAAKSNKAPTVCHCCGDSGNPALLCEADTVKINRHQIFGEPTKGNNPNPNKAVTSYAAVERPTAYTASHNSDVAAIVDTGSSYHIMADQRFFARLQICNVQLELVAGHVVTTLTIGTAHIKTENIKLLLEDVLVATGSVDILSLFVFVSHGHAANFGGNQSRILCSKGRLTPMTYGKGHTVPIVPVRSMSTGIAPLVPTRVSALHVSRSMTDTSKWKDVWYWHAAFGHCGARTFKAPNQTL